jgi:ADP-ribosylation factor GTPase-activating protein 2/3
VNNRRLDKFQGKTAISSEDYFDRPKTNQSSGLAPDMSVMKQDFKEGVSKVAGKLSGMASYAMSSLQVSKPLRFKKIENKTNHPTYLQSLL